ncbi:MAG TPA: FAD-dependent monooxygenase [Lentibacillus sp.]|uniref:FAD-dependent monooxygenase n=1 Tax=Lentibacillus sp. TaxID=1925746 RepID=UPI002B4AB59E|nr:FAD-dependent monooxygenase [Lentibacillus sp.]HLR63326.1 FAD-dependent monooxygenase [Lentibacillus sp.]
MTIAIIGGGIGGLAVAAGLHKIGIKAHVFEQAQSFKPLGAGIGIGSNAMLALDRIGIADGVIKSGMPLHEQRFLNGELDVMNRIDFSRLKQKFGEETLTIHRADLHEALFHAVDPAHFHFDSQVTDFVQHANHVTLTFQDNVTRHFDYVIAADGIHSIFRQTLVPGSEPRYAGYTCWRGITENKGDVPLHISSEAWSKYGRFGWAPLYGGDVYWFACVNAAENDAYYAKLDKNGAARLFAHFSPEVERLISESKDAYFLHHDLYDIKPLDSFVYDRIILLGDAAHAATPNMGQGAGQAIEDAYELMRAIDQEPSMEAALARYETKRVRKTNKVIKLSRQIGWAAQWQNPLLIGFRNTVFPLVPKSLLFWRLTFLFK